MAKYHLTPERPATEFRTIGIAELLTSAVSKRIGGRWWIDRPARPGTPDFNRVQNCVIAIERILIKNLVNGDLIAHAYVEASGQLHRIPKEYWSEDSAETSLRGRLFEIRTGHMFSKPFENSPVIVLQQQALRWLADENIYDTDQFFPSQLRSAIDAVEIKPRRQTKYNWPQFHDRAVEIMRDHGSFLGDWNLARLEEQMAAWCNEVWGREPSNRMIRDHARMAAAKFVSEIEKGDLGK